MDARRAVNVPRVRVVGFHAPQPEPDPSPNSLVPQPEPDPSSHSPAPNSVAVTRPRQPSAAVPIPATGIRRPTSGDLMQVGSYNPPGLLVGTSPESSSPSSSLVGDGDLSGDSSPDALFRFSDLNFSDAEFELPVVNAINLPGGTGMLIVFLEFLLYYPIDETQAVSQSGKTDLSMRQSSQKKDSPVAIHKKSGVRPLKRERKKYASPKMQSNDNNRVQKEKRQALLDQTEARNIVELFSHLPHNEHWTQLPEIESRFFQLDSLHPSVLKVGLRYLAGDMSRTNAGCIEMLRAFQEAVVDYSTSPAKDLVQDLTAKISNYVSFLTECRPLSISIGNAIRFVKSRIAKLHLSRTEYEAKKTLCSDINQFINEKIILAGEVIVGHAAEKVRDGDVLLTFGSSCVVEMILLHAHEIGKQFRVVVVDLRPKFESQALLRRLVAKGLTCTYTHVNAVSYVMHEVTRVFLGASSILCNGTVYSRIGTACVAMVAHAFCVPVLICCEAYKFHKRMPLDSISYNELGDPGAVAVVPGRKDFNYLENWTSQNNLQLLNLFYDATPSDYVSAVVTDQGIIPPSSVRVIVREAEESSKTYDERSSKEDTTLADAEEKVGDELSIQGPMTRPRKKAMKDFIKEQVLLLRLEAMSDTIHVWTFQEV
ncbi:hypothetical protein Fmac_008559 [Flemingia macrophylla]|uniref:Translation initiation factor eIF2B subunit delta n=1 Tax=Flemingia macrophylla TaxID=520843 RepID=A0ABD1MXU2_9FABA